MNEIQLQACFNLSTNLYIRDVHELLSNIRQDEPWEFCDDLYGWIENHVVNAPEQSEVNKIIQGCSESMSNELKSVFADVINQS